MLDKLLDAERPRRVSGPIELRLICHRGIQINVVAICPLPDGLGRSLWQRRASNSGNQVVLKSAITLCCDAGSLVQLKDHFAVVAENLCLSQRCNLASTLYFDYLVQPGVD